jgi:histidinol-phosphate aminotransferase
MAPDFAERTRNIPVYPAADGYSLDSDVAMLASNEAAFGPLEPVVEAARRAVIGANRYPDPSSSQLRQALADRYSVPVDRIAVGVGSCDLLLAAGAALLEPGAEVVYAWPSFSIYRNLGPLSGARAIEVPLTDEAAHDLDAMAAEVTVATRLVVICNPNNPTGTVLRLEDIEAFLERIPQYVCVILDEAYVEYALTIGDPFASLPLLERHPNLVILRTFSKVYGLASLRVGYGLCGSDSFRIACDQVRQPFYLSGAAQAAALEALRYQDEVERRVASAVAGRIVLTEALRERGLWVAESDANFVWARVSPDGDDASIVDGLKRRGVLIRAGSALGDPGCVRVTVGADAENSRFLAALDEVL